MSVAFFLVFGIACGGSATLLYALTQGGGVLQLLLVYILASMAAGMVGTGALFLRYSWTNARSEGKAEGFREARETGEASAF